MSFNDSTLLIRCISQYIIPGGLILKTDDRHGPEFNFCNLKAAIHHCLKPTELMYRKSQLR